MILQKLCKANLADLKDKKICCVECSRSYLEELCEIDGVLDHIEVIADDNEKKQGMFDLQGKNIPVCAMEDLKFADTEQWIIVITADYYREVFEYLQNSESVISRFEIVYYFANKETAYEEEFRVLYENHPLENIIIFRSGPHISSYIKGMDFTDNARALFEYMLAHGYNKKYELIWMVKNPEEFKRYSCYPNVHFLPLEWSVSEVKAEREQYYRALCLAKYIFFTDAYGIARNCRQDQIRVQLWHGCGFKTRLNFSPCEKRYEYMTVTSDMYADIHSRLFGLRKEQLIVTGCAKQDWLFDEDAYQYAEKLFLPEASKHIYWLPTYRKAADVLAQTNGYDFDSGTGFPLVDTMEKLNRLNELLAKNDVVLVIKLHPFQNRNKIHKIDFSSIRMLDNEQLFEMDIQINQLLGTADALISDYSSAAVDYMVLDRPMGFVLDDVNEYTDSRGFIFNDVREYLPGKEIYSFDDLCSFCEEIASGIDAEREKRSYLHKKMNKYQDRNNCKRILQALNIGLEE